MDIFTSRIKFVAIPDAMVSKSTLPNGKLRTQPMRETSFNKSNNTFDRKALRGQQKMNVIRHYDKRMQLVVALAAVLLQRLQK